MFEFLSVRVRVFVRNRELLLERTGVPVCVRVVLVVFECGSSSVLHHTRTDARYRVFDILVSAEERLRCSLEDP